MRVVTPFISILLGLIISVGLVPSLVKADPGATANDPFWSPDNLVDYLGTNQQVGDCGEPNGLVVCSANDFRITNLSLSNVVDGCLSPTDYMQADLTVTFSKARPTRYDVMAYFYRGEEDSVAFNLDPEAARIGTWCTRIGLQEGLDVILPGGTDSGDDTGDEEGFTPPDPQDMCWDAPQGPPGSADSTMTQTEFQMVLPCRDSNSDGIVDIAACTGWAQNDASFCDGAEYDGSNEPFNGSPSKCNCADFISDPAVSIPNITVVKTCTPTVVDPGGFTDCTITITNNGSAALAGASMEGEEGFFFEDDYPENQGTVSNIVVSQGLAEDGFIKDTNGNDTTNASLNFYPGSIAGSGGTATLDYSFNVDGSLSSNPAVDITNTVCASYLDPDTPSLTNTDVCSTEVVSTPVTLARFQAIPVSGGVEFEWSTSTESGNMGFNLYQKLGQSLYKLNDEIIPSQAVDSMEQLDYAIFVPVDFVSKTAKFVIEDVDIQGNAVKHGPFKPGASEQLKKSLAQKLDWKSINNQNLASSGKKGKKGTKGKAASTMLVELTVSNDGLQRVSFESLATLGIDTKRLTIGAYVLKDASGSSVASRVVKGKSNSASYLEFIANAAKTFYASSPVYQLDMNAKPNSAMAMRVQAAKKAAKHNGAADLEAFYMHSQSLAEDNIYVPSSKVPEDPWMMQRSLAIGSAKSNTHSVSVSNAVVGGSAQIAVEFAGGFDAPDEQDRRLELVLDGLTRDAVDADGNDLTNLAAEFEMEVEGGAVTFSYSNLPLNQYNADIVYLNQAVLTYPRRFVAIDDQLRFQSSGSAFAVSGLESAQANVYASSDSSVDFIGTFEVKSGTVTFNGVGSMVDYLVVGEAASQAVSLNLATRADLLAGASPNLVITHPLFDGVDLANYLEERQKLGFGDSTLVSTNDIYSRYSGGQRDARAIQQFIQEYAQNTQLASILIIGGDVYDYHDNLGIGAVSYVPTLYRATSDLMQYAPVDALYGDLSGNGLPEVAVGRLPVRTVDELSTSLGKLLEFNELRGANTSLLIADEKGNGRSYDFAAASENVANILDQRGWSVEKAYIDELGVSATRAALLSGLNEGPRMALYSGHSSPSSWSGRQIFRYQDALDLTNSDPSAYLQWGCYNTYFSSPTADSMSHGLMLSEQGGAAVVIGSSTLTDAFAESVFAVLIQDQLILDGATFGEAMIAAKNSFHDDYGLNYKGIMWGVSLLGDPLLNL